MTTGEDAYILVVDDEGAIRYSISKTLQRVGYQVHTAENGEKALEMMEHQMYDVVLTDIRMPGLTGVELLSEIKEQAPDAVVILLTGYASLETAIESLRLGAHDYLVKPSSSQDIRNSVAQGLERARNLRHRRVLLRSIRENVEELTGGELQLSQVESALSSTSMQSSVAETPVVTPVTTMTIGPLTIFPGRYQISVRGNDNTDKERVYNIALVRAAELTVQNGKSHFFILESQEDEKTEARYAGRHIMNVTSHYVSLVIRPTDDAGADGARAGHDVAAR